MPETPETAAQLPPSGAETKGNDDMADRIALMILTLGRTIDCKVDFAGQSALSLDDALLRQDFLVPFLCVVDGMSRETSMHRPGGIEILKCLSGDTSFPVTPMLFWMDYTVEVLERSNALSLEAVTERAQEYRIRGVKPQIPLTFPERLKRISALLDPISAIEVGPAPQRSEERI